MTIHTLIRAWCGDDKRRKRLGMIQCFLMDLLLGVFLNVVLELMYPQQNTVSAEMTAVGWGIEFDVLAFSVLVNAYWWIYMGSGFGVSKKRLSADPEDDIRRMIGCSTPKILLNASRDVLWVYILSLWWIVFGEYDPIKLIPGAAFLLACLVVYGFITKGLAQRYMKKKEEKITDD